jgi:hypothetical protein
LNSTEPIGVSKMLNEALLIVPLTPVITKPFSSLDTSVPFRRYVYED